MNLQPPKSFSILTWALNEESNVDLFFDNILRTMAPISGDFEIIFVDDGSTDQTYSRALQRAALDQRIRVIRLDQNKGASFAHRIGINSATKEYLFWQTVDWAYDLSQLPKMVESLGQYDVALGVRKRKIKGRSDNLNKSVVSLCNYWVVRVLFGVPLSDYQNIALYRTKFVQNVTYEANSAFGSPEFLIKAFWTGQSIKEFEMPFIPRKQGTAKGANVKNIRRAVYDILRLWWKWRILGKVQQGTQEKRKAHIARVGKSLFSKIRWQA